MVSEDILREINSLPAEAQRQIEDFVFFLREHYKSMQTKDAPSSDLETKPFVRMWKDREDMSDSSAWVRNIRETHRSK